MESREVYEIAPHEVLEAAGLEVLLVDTRQLASCWGDIIRRRIRRRRIRPTVNGSHGCTVEDCCGARSDHGRRSD
jgi:hypothetical protein